ncbi:hypothetical protein DESPIG_02444 [Desulfovibrio piger ATCC 29098]|uniref:Uncharacterized protein n=1 Tax=Desulfovibrio piger ATCC 29098 TaxID=411464 RepID=B6WWH6_9BACT|nr:hypothetical protein DESPIG_02444 [Desulfovibrio piger ATCC 29098]
MQLSRSWGKTIFAEKGRAVAQPAAARPFILGDGKRPLLKIRH